MKIVTWVLNFYPHRWRERYQEEMLAVLEQHTISLVTLLDLLLGALDAHLDPAYRTKEGFVFHRLRDTRTLSLIYICGLSIFLFSATLWTALNGSLAFQDNPLGSGTEAIALSATSVIIPGLGLIALLVVALATIKNALKHRRLGTLIYAIICIGLGIAGAFQELPFSPGPDYPLMELIFAWLLIGGIALCVGGSLFVTGVKGLQAIRKRQWWSVGFALAIDLLLPAGLMSYILWGTEGITPGTTIQLPPGGFLIGNMVFSSIANFITFLLLAMGSYLPLGALLLTLASNESSARGWRVTRGFGAAFTVVLVVNLAAVVIWDVNRWLGGGVWIFDPTHGVWPLFGGQWIGPLMTNALILAVALSLALLALIRSFLIRPGGEQSAGQMAA
jgi:hypothetical protein